MWKIVIVLIFSLFEKNIFLLLFKHSSKRFTIFFFYQSRWLIGTFITGLVADLQESLLVKRMAPTPAGRPCSFFFLHWIICHVLLYVSHSFNTCFTSMSILDCLQARLFGVTRECLGGGSPCTSRLAKAAPTLRYPRAARDPKQASPLAGYKHLHSLIVIGLIHDT